MSGANGEESFAQNMDAVETRRQKLDPRGPLRRGRAGGEELAEQREGLLETNQKPGSGDHNSDSADDVGDRALFFAGGVFGEDGHLCVPFVS